MRLKGAEEEDVGNRKDEEGKEVTIYRQYAIVPIIATVGGSPFVAE